MEAFKVITIEKASKYGLVLDADIRRFESLPTKPMIVKTKDIEDIFLLSDYELDDHVEKEHDWVKHMINEGMYKYFFLKTNKQFKTCNDTIVDTVLVFGDYREFMNLIHEGGHLKATDSIL